jgi:hypothetical protein
MDSYQKRLNYAFGYDTRMNHSQDKQDCSVHSGLLQRSYSMSSLTSNVPSNVYSPSMIGHPVYQRNDFPQCGNIYIFILYCLDVIAEICAVTVDQSISQLSIPDLHVIKNIHLYFVYFLLYFVNSLYCMIHN